MKMASHPQDSGRGRAPETKYVLERRDGLCVARPARSFDYLGGGRVYTRRELDSAIAIGASVTYYAAPPAVKIDGLTRGQAVALGVGSAGVLALLARWLLRK